MVDVGMNDALGSGTWVSQTIGQTVGLGGYVKGEIGDVGMMGKRKMKRRR